MPDSADAAREEPRVYNTSMSRFGFLLAFAAFLQVTSVQAAPAVDIETAAQLYQDAAIREQVRASLGAMPAHIRQLYENNMAAPFSDAQLAAVTVAAKRGFRIDVFEAPAL